MSRTEDMIIKAASSDLSIDVLLGLIDIPKIQKKRLALQLFDSDSIINKLHLQASYLNATASFKDGQNRSETLNGEILLFAAMSRQISEAIRTVGAKSPDSFIIFSNSSALFNRFSPNLSRIRDFRPNKLHSISAAKRYGMTCELSELNYTMLRNITLSKAEL